MKNDLVKNITCSMLMLAIIFTPFYYASKTAKAQSIAVDMGTLGTAISQLPSCKEEINSGMAGLFNGIGDLFSSSNNSTSPTNSNSLNTTSTMSRPGGLAGGGPSPANPSGPSAPQDSINTIAMPSFNNPPIREAEPTPYGDIALQRKLNELATDYISKTTGKEVYDKESAKKLEIIAREITQMKESLAAIRKKETCLDGIGKILAKMALQKMTMATVDWINNGFEKGGPAWMQNRTAFYKDIAKNEILGYGIEIQGSPYGKEWLKSQALAFKTRSSDNARYSLDELIQQTNPEYNSDTFYKDFSKGGWSAWSYLTQIPANNPLGFNLMASNELQKRLAGTEQSRAEGIREDLIASGGFLGDERCVDPITGKPNGVTRAAHNAALNEGKILCPSNQWEYVTPGKLIAQKAIEITEYSNDALINADDLDSALSAITDAVINHFSNKFMSEGFASLDDQYSDGSLSYSSDSRLNFTTQVERDFSPIHGFTSSWLKQNPNFNIRTDLTQALIDEQRTYIAKLRLQNREINSTRDGKDYASKAFLYTLEGGQKTSISNAYGIMPTIYQLDYCIPGPHPGWENDSRQTLSKKLSSINEPEPFDNKVGDAVNGAIGAGINIGASAIPTVGQFVGPLLSGLFGAVTEDDTAKRVNTTARQHYTREFYKLTGMSAQAPYGVNPNGQVDANMSSKEGLFQVMNGVLERYANIMNQTYFSDKKMLPPVADESAKYFNLLPGYSRLMEENDAKIKSLEATISILQDIKTKIDKLNDDLRNHTITQETETGAIITLEADSPEEASQYQKYLQAQIDAFGRESANMINGNDIAIADNTAKEIKDQSDYIYKYLIKGPYGCEAHIEKYEGNFPSPSGTVKIQDYNWSNFNINSVARMTYPFPILYDYNILPKGSIIPDPMDSGYPTNELPKMPDENMYDKFGPGFLSFVHFATTYGDHDRDNRYNGPERLSLYKLIYDYNTGGQDGKHVFDFVSLGRSKMPGTIGGVFEHTIGIY